jgi:hypothetical protein
VQWLRNRRGNDDGSCQSECTNGPLTGEKLEPPATQIDADTNGIATAKAKYIAKEPPRATAPLRSPLESAGIGRSILRVPREKAL